jgi:hypothetical protein
VTLDSEPIPRARAQSLKGTTESGNLVKPPVWPRFVQLVIWLVIAAPAIYQVVLLVTAIAGRVGYPYDLEWMEGGLLHHAQRIRDGSGIYVPPSIDFIPYLYTPLYPSLIALFGGAFGVTYTVGRMISVISLLGIVLTAILQIPAPRHEHPRLGPPWAGVVLAFGLFAAAYPITDGWYDIVRADTLFLLLITTGIGALPRWSVTGTGLAGHAQVAASAVVLSLAFFCKQTGIIYVGLGGVIVLALNWRRAPAFVLTAAAIGFGGTAVLNRATHGWFWTYVSDIHRAHDFNWDRVWASFGNILWHCKGNGYEHPMLGAPITIVVGLSLALVAYTYHRTRRLPPQTRPLLIWSSVFGVSVIVGAIGWGTEYAHFNAYMPAFLHGALAAGAAPAAVYACTRVLWGDRPRRELATTGAAVAIALPLSIICITARWNPEKFIPTEADVAAGDRLIARLRTLPEPVWMPSHPWYLYMAGKTPRVHRMGIVDVTTRQTRTVEGLDDALTKRAFGAIVLDDADLHNRATEWTLKIQNELKQNYRPALSLPKPDGACGRSWVCRTVLGLPQDERPHVYTGAKVQPDTIWLPQIPAVPPPGAKSLFDFENPTWDEARWRHTGPAWGGGPVGSSLPGQDLVLGASGSRYATSQFDGDKTMGRVTSPEFALDAAKLTLKLGGSIDGNKLRVELVVEDAVVDAVLVPQPGGAQLRTVSIPIPENLRAKIGHLVFVDDSTVGHLVVDDVWAWAPKAE